MKTKALAYVAVLFISACQGPGENVSASEAVQITNRYWADSLPQVDLSKLNVDAVDKGDRWRVIYRPPDGSTGGPFVYDVDKKTGKIIHSDGGQ